jgi:hypothetical protein
MFNASRRKIARMGLNIDWYSSPAMTTDLEIGHGRK